jgi:hypothetical protein
VGADGFGLISHRSGDIYTGLEVAHCLDPLCSQASSMSWGIPEVLGNHSSITVGPDGLPLISSTGLGSQTLKVLRCSDPTCSSGTSTRVDPANNVGYSSTTVGTDGLPLISYYDTTNGDLKVANCSSTLCVPYFRRR